VGWKERTGRYAIGFTVSVAIYLLLILAYVYPHWPVDIVGWAIIIIVGIPVSFCLELIGENFFSRQMGQRVSGKRLSVKRIGIALLVIVGLAGVLFLLQTVCDPFIRPHFK
jgi:hypothetical protein